MGSRRIFVIQGPAAPYLPLAGRSDAAVSAAWGWATTHRPSRQSRPIAGLGALPIKTGMKSFRDRSRKGRNTLVLKLFFFDAWTEPPERACVSLPRHECAVFGGERKYLRE